MIDLKVLRFLASPSYVFFRHFQVVCSFVTYLRYLQNSPLDLQPLFLKFSGTIDAGIAGLIVRGAEKVAQQAGSVWLLLLFLVDKQHFHSRQKQK